MLMQNSHFLWTSSGDGQGEVVALPQLEGAQPGDIVWAFDDEPEPVAPKTSSAVAAEPGRSSEVALPVAVTRGQVVRIDADKVDSILNLVGELVVIKSQILQDESILLLKEQRLSGLLLLLDKTVRELQETSLSMRMTSLRPVLLKVQRGVSELSARLGRSVDLQISGEDTEIDRSIVELLADPLMHLCRNALDHGIEPPRERAALGKSEKGVLRIAAGRQGGKICIEVGDDGKGLDREKILAVARARSLIPDGENTEAWNDRAVFDLIFLPGFSTAAEANDISGRGVGLDVVKTNLEQVKGSVEVRSEKGRGTVFRLGIPLTTAISDAMLLRVANDTYVLPIEVIRELVQPEPGMISEGADGSDVVNVRGTLLPLLPLSQLLAPGEEGESAGSRLQNQSVIIVVEAHDTRVALLVDAVLGQSQVVVKTLGPALPASRGVGGAAILGDGRVGLIIDVLDLIAGYGAQ